MEWRPAIVGVMNNISTPLGVGEHFGVPLLGDQIFFKHRAEQFVHYAIFLFARYVNTMCCAVKVYKII